VAGSDFSTLQRDDGAGIIAAAEEDSMKDEMKSVTNGATSDRQAARRGRAHGPATARGVRPALVGRAGVVGLAGLALVAGCESKLSQEKFDRIASGMTTAEVRDILGEPDESSSIAVGGLSGTSATWRSDDGARITIRFVNEKVQLKNFQKP